MLTLFIIGAWIILYIILELVEHSERYLDDDVEIVRNFLQLPFLPIIITYCFIKDKLVGRQFNKAQKLEDDKAILRWLDREMKL